MEMFINLYEAGVVNRTLFMLVFEDALQSNDPSKYYETQKSKFITFPEKLGKRDLLKIIKYFDSDRDNRLSRSEIRAKFI